MAKTSQFIGVSKNTIVPGTYRSKFTLPWAAALSNSKTGKRWNASFNNEREAAIAYDKKVLELGLDRPLNILKRVNYAIAA